MTAPTLDEQIALLREWIDLRIQNGSPLATINAARALVATLERARELQKLQPLSQWSDDDGDVLWWTLPINEPPYVGSPLSSDWPGQHTHWSRIIVPEATQ